MTDKPTYEEPMKKSATFRLVIAVFLLTLLPTLADALTAGQIFDKVKDSIVVVRTLDNRGNVMKQGSGVFLPSGMIATNCHVVEGGFAYKVGGEGEFILATLISEASEKDICLLHIRNLERWKPVELGKAANLKVGDPIYAVGTPRSLELSISDGIVSQLRGEPAPMIQITASISPGSSGGGLFDSKGRLVGLTTLYLEGGQNLNFALPVEWIDEIKSVHKENKWDIKWVIHAYTLGVEKDWEEKANWCLMWTKSEPNNGMAWEMLGDAYYELNRYDEALNAYRQATGIDPQDSDAWAGLGMAYGKLKHYDAAIDAYGQAVRFDPNSANKWYNLGVTYTLTKQFDDAIDAYRQAIRIDPEYASAWFNLGIVYYYSGKERAALDAGIELRRLDPVRADKLFDLIVPR